MKELRFDPAGYPGWRPDGPMLVFRGETHPVTVDGARTQPVRAPVDAPVLHAGAARWSVAYGGNACPDRLVDKGLDRRGALLLPARLRGWQPVFEGRLTRYGSAPLTLVPAPDRVMDTWVLGVHEDDLPTLDRSEGRYWREEDLPGHLDEHDAVTAPPGAYLLGHVGPVAVADRFCLPDALAYLPGPGTVLAAGGDDALLGWPQHDQAAARVAVDARRTAATPSFPMRTAPPGLWPPTPFEDLPLFVYGTLGPDGSRWPLVADLIADVQPARGAGQLHDTGHGWPAALFGDSGTVHGHLLHPLDAPAGQELYRRADRIEGTPNLFTRTTVEVVVHGGSCWAVGYAWADSTLPGERLLTGRWPD